jgi:hypothetical protein
MSLKHTAFLFDYYKFQSTIDPLIQALNGGNHIPLQEKVAQIRQEITAEENWILNDKGAFISDDAGLIHDDRYQNALWGHRLLIILSTFLKPVTSFEYDWAKLSVTLRSIEWDIEDIDRLIKGQPISWLLKPETDYQYDMKIEWALPYWYWIRPIRCTYCGWLPTGEIGRLHRLLQFQKDLIEGNMQNLIQLPANVTQTNAHISPELDPNHWYTKIPKVYNQALQIMEHALNHKQGLFTVIYQEYGNSE